MRCCMKEYDFNKLLESPELVESKINEFLNDETLKRETSSGEILGHLQKAEHNLRFVQENTAKFFDWAITGCYYACYHAALSLILTKGYSSKNHLATLCILIKEFYKKGLSAEDIELFCTFLDYEDLQFYVESKNNKNVRSQADHGLCHVVFQPSLNNAHFWN